MRMTKKKMVKGLLLEKFKERAAWTTSDVLEIEDTDLCQCWDDPHNRTIDRNFGSFKLCARCKISRSTKRRAIVELGGWMEIEPHPQAWWKVYGFYFIDRKKLEALLLPMPLREWELTC